jgi:nucleoside-triphosphatase THEP1
MLRLQTPRAMLITGPFGSGKSSLVGEIADVVEGTIPSGIVATRRS